MVSMIHTQIHSKKIYHQAFWYLSRFEWEGLNIQIRISD